MFDRDLFARCAAPYGVEATPELLERLDIYARLLVEWNQKMNLTAITDPVGGAVKHFADSLTAAPLLPEGKFTLIDVGTGAGFPGVPLALYREDCKLTLLDSLNKRIDFLKEPRDLRAVLDRAVLDEAELGCDAQIESHRQMMTEHACAFFKSIKSLL